MYHLEHLLALLTAEKATELQFRAGSPPMVVSENERHPLQGPPTSNEDLMKLLRSLTSSRQMRNLRESGVVRFVYALPGRSPFLVHATMENENIAFDIS
jgi:Tfp pilus assembly pilus retraction ATPase PilT